MTSLPHTRESLLVRLRQRSGDAWSEFLEIYEQALVQYAQRRGLQEADARDVTQEVLAAVNSKIDDWNADPNRGKFRGWLFRVARNIAVDKVVAQSKRAAASGDTHVAQMLAEHPCNIEEESTLFWLDYRKKLLHWAAKQVKPEVKEVSWKAFWMTAIEGRKPETVARLLDTSVGNVYAAKFRIVARIREIITRIDDSQHLGADLSNELKTSQES